MDRLFYTCKSRWIWVCCKAKKWDRAKKRGRAYMCLVCHHQTGEKRIGECYTKKYVAHTVMCRQDGRGRFLVLLDDLSKCWTNSQRKSQLSLNFFIWYLHGMMQQYNKLHEHWYTKISSFRCVEDRNPPQNASDLYTCIWNTGHMQSIAGPVHASAVWTEEKRKKKHCSYRIFIVCR